MKIDRLINDPYWEQLPFLVEEYMNESNIENFYSSSSDFIYPAFLAKEFILTMIYNKINNISIDNFTNKQKNLQSKNKTSYLSKKEIIKFSKTLGRISLKRDMSIILDKYLETIEVEKWVVVPELQGYVFEQHNNLHEIYIMFCQISRLSEFREKPMIPLNKLKSHTRFYLD